MYEFEDKNGDVLSLRPEGTAPVARAVIQHHLYDTPVLRLFYTGPMFRRERPQAGRYRQFHQFGIEAFGVSEPYMDIESTACCEEDIQSSQFAINHTY